MKRSNIILSIVKGLKNKSSIFIQNKRVVLKSRDVQPLYIFGRISDIEIEGKKILSTNKQKHHILCTTATS